MPHRNRPREPQSFDSDTEIDACPLTRAELIATLAAFVRISTLLLTLGTEAERAADRLVVEALRDQSAKNLNLENRVDRYASAAVLLGGVQ